MLFVIPVLQHIWVDIALGFVEKKPKYLLN